MIKAQKKNQLALLLTNKFRNKFAISPLKEQALDKIIRDEIDKLLADGTATESKLTALDKKLEYLIKQARNAPKDLPNPEQAYGTSLTKIDGDARSEGQKSMRASVTKSMGASPANAYETRVVYEDPAAALNLTDKKWNSIVENNLKAFNEEKVRVKEERLAKNKRVQEEQRKQIAEKQRLLRMERDQERDHFNTVGINSSDVYYVNHDKKEKQIAQLKGGSKIVAADLNNKYSDGIHFRNQKMKLEAEERKKIQSMLLQEDEANK